MKKLSRKMSPARMIALSFILVILIGSLLLELPCCLRDGVELSYIDALFTSTSAVCVTGLITLQPGLTFTPFGQFILALLIQIGGLGVMTMGAGLILVMGRKVNMRERTIFKESMNIDSGKGLIRLVYRIFTVTLIIEFAGAILSFLSFRKRYTLVKAIGVSLFHSVAAFNNSGIVIFEDGQNMIPYENDVLLNLTTCALMICGGIGFLVICELWDKKLSWKRLSMHSKVVMSVSMTLTISGMLLLKMTEHMSWLSAFFFSVSSRAAGFYTRPVASFSKSGILVITVLMFIGASPGSTGGGIKTSTLFVLLQGIRSAATNQSEKAFGYAIPKEAFKKASVVTILSFLLVVCSTYIMGIFEPEFSNEEIFMEMISACGTVGISSGITADLCIKSKLLSILIMYIGRLGPLTVANLWHYSKGERVGFPEGDITIG